MKKIFLVAVTVFAAGSIFAADTAPKALVEAAIRKLAEQPNYSWSTTVTLAEGSNPGPRPGPTAGKTENGGYTEISMVRGDKTIEAFLQRGKGAIKTPEGWKSLAETAQDHLEGVSPMRMAALMLLDYQLPTVQTLDLAEKTESLTLTNGAYASALTDTGARELFSFRRAGMGKGGGPSMRDVGGFVRFWVKDGLLVKCEFRLHGLLSFAGDDHFMDRTTTVEIKDIGTTKITVPAEAAKKTTQ